MSRQTFRDQISINSTIDVNDKITLHRVLKEFYLRVSGLDICGYMKNFISYVPEKFTSILVAEESDKTRYLTIYHDRNTISILTDHHPTPGIINKYAEYEIDKDAVISFIIANGIKIKNLERE